MSEQNSSEQYFRLKVVGLARAEEELFTDACFEIGADGIAEDLKFVQKDLRYDPDVVETARLDLNVYFAQAPDESSLLKLQARFPEARYEILREENKDWLAEWKKGFLPFRFAGDFWVIPSWLKPPVEVSKDESLHIYVEPGMAFGTGTHETTKLAAGLLIEELERGARASLIDVGTGTGILALIALRLGVQEIVGIDIDPEARRTARENLERNQASAIQIPDWDIKEVSAAYDIVVANIIDGVLTILRHDLVRALKPGGRMILSGILTDREAAFYQSFTADTGLKILKTTREGEWAAALLEKI